MPDSFFCALCGGRHFNVVGRYCDSCQDVIDRGLLEIALGDELSDAVVRLVEFALDKEGAVDRDTVRRAMIRLEAATGAATTRVRLIELAALALAAAIQIPTTGHDVAQENRNRARRNAMERGWRRRGRVGT